MKKRLIMAVSVILIMSLMFSGCGKNAAQEPVEEETVKEEYTFEDGIVAVIGDIRVTQEDFNYVYKSMYDQMEQSASFYGENWIEQSLDDSGKTIKEYIKENAVNHVLEIAASNLLAQEMGIKFDEELQKLADETKKSLIESYGGEKDYRKYLENARTTQEAIDRYVKHYEIYKKYYNAAISEGGAAYVSEENIVNDFRRRFIKVQHILISTQPETDSAGNPNTGKSDSEAQYIAKDIISQLENGEDFDVLIERYNEDPGMSKGNYYIFTDGEMVAEFEDAAKKLKVGEFTKEAVKTNYGYHIIKKYEIDTENEQFETYKKNIFPAKVAQLITAKIRETDIKLNEKLIESYTEEWLKELVLKKNDTETKTE